MAHIRLYNPTTDFSACINAFNATADSSLSSPELLSIGSYHWCRPYLYLCPTTSLVLDDGVGNAVGYCIGTSETAEFCKRWREEYLPSLNPEKDGVVFDQRGDVSQKAELDAAEQSPSPSQVEEQRRAADLRRTLWNDPEGGCNGEVEGLWEKFPGHLHIDILPSHQGQGWGPQLVRALLQQMRHERCEGVHLGVVRSNLGALKFYERVGFQRYDGVEEEGETGRKGGAVIMVKRL